MKEYIEREALLELYADAPDIKLDMMSVPIPIVRQNILDMPAADVVERKRGEWIKRPDERICPFCNDSHSYFGGAEKKFCSECGADMRSHQNILCDQTEEADHA